MNLKYSGPCETYTKEEHRLPLDPLRSPDALYIDPRRGHISGSRMLITSTPCLGDAYDDPRVREQCRDCVGAPALYPCTGSKRVWSKNARR